MNSWRTTVFGLLASSGLSVSLLEGLPHWLLLAAKVSEAIGLAGLGLAARDNNKTSEQVGLTVVPNLPAGGGPIRIPLMLLCGALAFGLVGGGLAGCKTTPTRAIYTAEAATQMTVEKALGAWNDYVGAYHPPASQEIAVRSAYRTYQAAMVAAIDASEVYAAAAASNATNAPAARAAAEVARQAAAGRLADLVNLLQLFGVKL